MKGGSTLEGYKRCKDMFKTSGFPQAGPILTPSHSSSLKATDEHENWGILTSSIH